MKGFDEILRSNIEGDVHTNVRMDGFTSFKVGGKADIMACPKGVEDIRKIVRLARENNLPLLTIGAGSNLLVRDQGIRGVVLNISRGLKELEEKGEERIYCGAGLSMTAVLNKAAKLGLGGLEFMAGIPGTVGGAVRMNAGAFGNEIKDLIESVVLVDGSGEIRTIKREDLSFSYRDLEMKEGDIIAGCTFQLHGMDIEVIRERIKRFSGERAKRQPLNMPTAGSVFKNPSGDFAGRLIDEAGLKGMVVGNARVSEKHANFIENMGGATATDILTLMELVKDRVFRKSGVRLEPEVKIVGEGSDTGVKVLN